MFVSTKVHILALERCASSDAQRELLERQHTTDQNTIAWLCARVNQLEAERATLFHAVTQLNIPVPTVTPAPAAPVTHHSTQPFAANMFEDMGEEEARRQGIEHAPDGSVRYTN